MSPQRLVFALVWAAVACGGERRAPASAPFVSHAFADATKGAVGVLRAKE